MSSSVTFREATSADYDDVMNIGDIYDGLDYLPVRYHDYCADPRRHMFVAEDDGKVVAFAMRLVTDGGCSNVTEAHRVRKEYTRRGIMTSLGNHAHREIMKRYPSMERTLYTTVFRAAVESTVKKLPYKLLDFRPRFSCDITLQDLPDILMSTQFHKLASGGPYQLCKRQSKDEALASLLHEVPFSQFVPEGMWIIEWEPMGHHVDNYQNVVKNSSFYVSRGTEDGAIQAVSFFTTVRVPRGWRSQGDFYCPCTEQNPYVLVAHVLRHLEEMSSLKEASYISYSTSYSKSYPGHISKDHLFTQLKELKHRGGSFEYPALLVSMNVADMERHLDASS